MVLGLGCAPVADGHHQPFLTLPIPTIRIRVDEPHTFEMGGTSHACAISCFPRTSVIGATASSEIGAGFDHDEELNDCGLAKLHSDQPFIPVVRGDVANLSLNLKDSLIAGNR